MNSLTRNIALAVVGIAALVTLHLAIFTKRAESYEALVQENLRRADMLEAQANSIAAQADSIAALMLRKQDTVRVRVVQWRARRDTVVASLPDTCAPAVELLAQADSIIEVQDSVIVESSRALLLWRAAYDTARVRGDLLKATLDQRPKPAGRWSVGVTTGYGAVLHDQRIVTGPSVVAGVSFKFR